MPCAPSARDTAAVMCSMPWLVGPTGSPRQCACPLAGASLVAHGAGPSWRTARAPGRNWPCAQGSVFETWAGDEVADRALDRTRRARSREEDVAWRTRPFRPCAVARPYTIEAPLALSLLPQRARHGTPAACLRCVSRGAPLGRSDMAPPICRALAAADVPLACRSRLGRPRTARLLLLCRDVRLRCHSYDAHVPPELCSGGADPIGGAGAMGGVGGARGAPIPGAAAIP